MNIAFVISTKIWGGVKTWMVEFGEALQKRGHQVYFFSNDQKLTDEVKSNNCQAYCLRFGPDYSPVTIRFFYKKFKEHGIDITCMNIQKELRTAGWAAKLLKIPVTQRLGLPGDINFKLDQRFSQRFIVDELLVTSQWMKKETARRFHFVPEEKITVIYNTKPVVCLPRKEKRSPVRFVITSRLAIGKGHKDLIDALKLVKEQGYNEFKCDAFGNGPLEKEIRQQITMAGLENTLILKGFSRNLKEELKHYDFGILTSSQEGLANTVSEYMSVALPVITTNGGALPELVDHEKNGFLFEYQNVKALSQYIIRCLEMDNKTYAVFSSHSHNTVAQKFNIDVNVKALETYFADCVEKYRS